MATVINPLNTPSTLPDKRRRDGSGGGANGDSSGRQVIQQPRNASSTGIKVGLCAITMSFAALSSAMIVRKGSTDWKHFDLPVLLYFNTLVLMASSLTLEVARRRVANFMRSAGMAVAVHPSRWLETTLGLGLVFLTGQLIAWHRLAQSGFYVSTNPSSSFFYVLTAGHALHLFGGLFGLLLVIYRLSGPAPTLRKSTIDAAAYYWHFMGVLWLYLLLLLRFQL